MYRPSLGRNFKASYTGFVCLQVACLDMTMIILYVLVLFAIFGWWWTFHAAEEELGVQEPLLHIPEDNELERPDPSAEIHLAEV